MPSLLGVRRKYKLRRIFSGKLMYLVLMVLLVILTRAAFGMYERGKEAMAKREESYRELKILEERESELRSEIARLSTPRGIEEELRERYLISKEGESVAVVSDPPLGEPISPLTPEKGFWKKFLSAVGFSGE